MKKRLYLINVSFILAIIIVLFCLTVVYFYFYNLRLCHDLECFQENMEKCTRAEYISEEPEASWFYDIRGFRRGECVVGVKLIQAKEGELEIGKLNGLDMECVYPKGVATYPEKNLNKCHGILKEELQGVVIRKLHGYIVENLGQIDNEVGTAF